MSERGLSARISMNGFTLVELLVVLAIVSLLLALLFPVLGRGRSVAHLAVCQSNLRQIGVATHCYVQDNKEWMPTNWVLGGYFYRQAPGTRTPGDPFASPERYGLAALFDKPGYMDGNSEAWVCPAQPSWMKEWGNTYAFSTSAEHEKKRFFQLMIEPNNWVWDNYFWYPYITGQRAGKGTIGFLLPPEKQVRPHDVGVSLSGQKRASNFLRVDGHVFFENER